MRSGAAPNFSFLGQLKEHERQLGLVPQQPPALAQPARTAVCMTASADLMDTTAPPAVMTVSGPAALEKRPSPPPPHERPLCSIAESPLTLLTPPSVPPEQTDAFTRAPAAAQAPTPPPLPPARQAVVLSMPGDEYFVALSGTHSMSSEGSSSSSSFSNSQVQRCICCSESPLIAEASGAGVSQSHANVQCLPPPWSPPLPLSVNNNGSLESAESTCTARPVRTISLGLASRRAAAQLVSSSPEPKPVSRQSAPNAAAAASPAKGTRLKLQLTMPAATPAAIASSGSQTATVAQNVSLVGPAINSQAPMRETPASASALPISSVPPLAMALAESVSTSTPPPQKPLQVAVSGSLVITPTAELAQLHFGGSPVQAVPLPSLMPAPAPSTPSASSSTISSASSNSPPMACFQSKICKTERAPSLFACSIKAPIPSTSTSTASSSCCPPPQPPQPQPLTTSDACDDCFKSQSHVPSADSDSDSDSDSTAVLLSLPIQRAATNSNSKPSDFISSSCAGGVGSGGARYPREQTPECVIRAFGLRQTAPTSSSNIPPSNANATTQGSHLKLLVHQKDRHTYDGYADADERIQVCVQTAPATATRDRSQLVEPMSMSLASKVTKETSSVPSSPDPPQFNDPLPLSASGESFAQRPAPESVLHPAGSAPEVEALSKLPHGGTVFLSVSRAQFNKYNDLLAKHNHQLIAAGCEEPVAHKRAGSARGGRSQRLMLLAGLSAQSDSRGSTASRSRSRTAENSDWPPLLPLTESHSLDALQIIPAFS